MITTAKRIFLTLGITGLIPFLVGAMMTQMGVNFGTQVFLSYSVVILAFLGGSLWGQAFRSEGTHKRLLLTSNIIALSAWIGLLLDQHRLATGLLLVGYLAAFAIEQRYRTWLITWQQEEYRLMRLWLTLIVIGMHIWVWVALSS